MPRQLPAIPTRNGMKRPRSRGAQSPTLADIVVDRIAGLIKNFNMCKYFVAGYSEEKDKLPRLYSSYEISR